MFFIQKAFRLFYSYPFRNIYSSIKEDQIGYKLVNDACMYALFTSFETNISDKRQRNKLLSKIIYLGRASMNQWECYEHNIHL